MGPALAIIDIGSNTVLLTAGCLDEAGKLQVLLECHDVARLSEGLQDGGPLNEKAKRRALEILADFKSQAHARGITSIEASGTAAFRRAGDGKAFAQQIQTELGIPTRILEGKEEAHYSYLSAVRDFGDGTIGMIDIGGNSTEVVSGTETNWKSLPLGTVRLLEGFVTRQPIVDAQWHQVQNEIQRVLKEFLILNPSQVPTWVAVAATPTSLASVMQGLPGYKPDKVHGFNIKRTKLEETVDKLRVLSLGKREKVPGMPPKRAELLPLGGLILLEIMDYLGISVVKASHHGLRYGLLWEALEKKPASA